MADHELCGAIYTELYNIDKNKSHIADLVMVLDEELKNITSDKNWYAPMLLLQFLPIWGRPLRSFGCCSRVLHFFRAVLDGLGGRGLHHEKCGDRELCVLPCGNMC